MPRFRLLLAYDGSGFRGVAPNRGVRTVGGEVVEVCELLLGHSVSLTVAGRTDAGVHAWGQVATFDTDRTDVSPSDLQAAVNGRLAPEVVVRAADIAPATFDARRSALGRAYRYTVVNRPVADPFLAPTAWHVPAALDVAAMRQGCSPLVGEHDFTSFCRRPKVAARAGAGPTPGDGVGAVGIGPTAPSLTRRVLGADWVELGDGVLRFEIRASSFCQQMVRSVVGLLVDVGRGRRTAADVQAVLQARDRSGVGQLAPPHGLCLWEVSFGPDVPSARPALEPDTPSGLAAGWPP